MNTFVLLGLAAALALFLLRSKRRRAGATDTDPTPSPARPGRGFGRRRVSATPDPVPADHAPSPFSSPAPLAAPGPAGGFGPVETFTPAEPARSPFPATPAPSDWAPAETIVEPGWPLPGEIAGTWTGGPEASAAPVATVEAPAAHAETAATATHAPLRSSDSWEMPALTPVDPITPEAHPAGGEPSGPPAWTPGAEDAAPAWPPAEDALPVWSPDAPDAPAPDADAPAVAWTPADAVPAADEPAAGEPELPLWRPEPPTPPTADPIPDADPVAAVTEPLPVTDPAPVWDAPPPVVAADPAPAPEWNAPPPEPALSPVAPAVEAVPAWDAPPPAAPAEPAAPEPFAEVTPAWVPPPAPVLEPVPVIDPAPTVVEAPAADLGVQSAEVAQLVPAVLSALRPLVRVSDHVGITPRMLVVVRHLAASPLSVGELAGLLGVSRPVVADIAARLESAGLTLRERDERDRRRVRLVLTARGRRVHDEAGDAPPADAVAEALTRMEPAERDALVRGLRALSRSASP